MTILENKTGTTVLPAVWITAVTSLILAVYLMGLQTTSRGSTPPNPMLAGLSLNIDRERPMADLGPNGIILVYEQIQRLTASDGSGHDFFGTSVSISGNNLAIGAPEDDDLGNGSGAVYLFKWDPGTQMWLEEKKITASDGSGLDLFGALVRLSGDTLFVGGYGQSFSTNQVYIYERNLGGEDNWGELTILTPSNASGNPRYGTTFAVAGDLLFVGAYFDTTPTVGHGSVFIYQKDLGGMDNWGELMKLESPDAAAARFGHSVSVSGDILLVGAPLTDGAELSSGTAYVFEKDLGGPNNWGHLKTLTASDEGENDQFGSAVAISGDNVYVNAGWHDHFYIFERDEGGPDNWGEVASISFLQDNIYLGYPGFAHIDQNLLFVFGASETDEVGIVFVFDQNFGGSGNWGVVQTLVPTELGEDNYLFGQAFSSDGDILVLGHPGQEINGTPFTGAGFLYRQVTTTPTHTATSTATAPPTETATSTSTPSPTSTITPSVTPTQTTSPTATIMPEDTFIYLPIVIHSP